MELYYFTFRSVTYAQKGQRILEKQGISCWMGRAPKWMTTRGCGYAVKVRKLQEAVTAFRISGAEWEKIYRIRDGEKPEEVTL